MNLINRILISIIILIIFAVIACIILISTNSKIKNENPPQGTSQLNSISPSSSQKEISGVIQKISPQTGVINIKMGNNIIALLTTTLTKYYDENNAPSTFNYLQESFTINVEGLSTKSDSITAQKITVTTAPNILVEYPLNDTTVPLNFEIKGKARVFENVFNIRVKGVQSNFQYLKEKIEINQGELGNYNPFIYTISLNPKILQSKKDTMIIVELFQNSPKDGQEVDPLLIPLNIR